MIHKIKLTTEEKNLLVQLIAENIATGKYDLFLMFKLHNMLNPIARKKSFIKRNYAAKHL